MSKRAPTGLRPRVAKSFHYAQHDDGWEVEVKPHALGLEAIVRLSVWGRKPLKVSLAAEDLEGVGRRLRELGANLAKAGKSLGRRPLEEP